MLSFAFCKISVIMENVSLSYTKTKKFNLRNIYNKLQQSYFNTAANLKNVIYMQCLPYLFE